MGDRRLMGEGDFEGVGVMVNGSLWGDGECEGWG